MQQVSRDPETCASPFFSVTLTPVFRKQASAVLMVQMKTQALSRVTVPATGELEKGRVDEAWGLKSSLNNDPLSKVQ